MTSTYNRSSTGSADARRTHESLNYAARRIRGKRVALKLGICLLCGGRVHGASDARAKRVFCSAEHEALFCITAFNRSWTYSV